MASPVYTASAVPPICALVDVGGGGTAGFHPLITPVCEAKMNRAGPLDAPECTTKSAVLFETIPVGAPPPGIVTTSDALTIGPPPTSPEYSVETPETLSATQNGLVARDAMPHGFTRL